MSERIIMISVLDENGTAVTTVNFTESELKRRLYEIRDDALPMSDCRSMLLYGKWRLEREKHLDGKTYVTDDQPSPAPTRAEWLETMPRQMLYEEWHTWADAFCEWFLSMPKDER